MKRRSTVIRIRRRQRDICKSHGPILEIPFDLVIEILTRLPAKSLMRFKALVVLNLFPTFSNRVLKLSSLPRLYMCVSFVDNSHHKSVVLSLSPPDSDITMSSFVIDQDLTILAMKGFYLSHVYRSLMCFVNEPSAQIYNTTTRQLVVLRDIEESNIIAKDHNLKKVVYYIGHDPVQDLYKVVFTIARPNDEVDEYTFLSEYWILLLGGDGSSRWRKISCGSPPHLPLRQGLTISGHMHYLAWVRVSTSCVLVRLDINSEEISMLQVPEDRFWPYTGFIEYGGKLALLHYVNLKTEGVVELWVVEDANKNRWSCKTLVLHPSQMDMVNNSGSLKVRGTTRKGEVILAPEDTNLFHIFLYDLQKNHMRKIEIKGAPNHHLTKFCEVVGLDYVENLMYL